MMDREPGGREKKRIKIKMESRTGRLPAYETEGSAGMDLGACLKEPITLKPGERTLVPTGIRMELPPGYEAQIRARSGLAIGHGITLVNGVGTVDSDYRGEIKVALINLGTEEHMIEDGDRIAQMVVAAYAKVDWTVGEELGETKRGPGGFGHTGKKVR